MQQILIKYPTKIKNEGVFNNVLKRGRGKKEMLSSDDKNR